MPLTMLEKTLQGLSLEEIIDRRHSGQIKKLLRALIDHLILNNCHLMMIWN